MKRIKRSNIENNMKINFNYIATHLLLISAVVSTSIIFFCFPSVKAQKENSVYKNAKLITVKLEGASQGSGSLYKREGDLYTVMTAWHVVKGQTPAEELDILTFDGKSHKVIGSSIQRLGKTDTALVSFRSSRDYLIPTNAKRISKGEEIFISGFPLDENINSPKIVKAYAIGITDCHSQVNKGALLYKLQIPKKLSKLDYQERFETSKKWLMYPESDTRIGMSGGPILLKNGLIIGHHNGGLGGSSDWGVAIKFGLNRGSIIPNNTPFVEGYIEDDVVCAVFNAHESWIKGMYQEAANYSLAAYNLDKKSIPFISGPLQSSLGKLGRFDLLCEIHSQGANLNNISMDYICKYGMP